MWPNTKLVATAKLRISIEVPGYEDGDKETPHQDIDKSIILHLDTFLVNWYS